MGHTHYFTTTRALTTKRGWSLFKLAGRAILDVAQREGIPVAGRNGEGDPEFTDEVVGFNGQGEDAFDSFVVRRDGYVERLCKTGFVRIRPYDCAVVAILAMGAHYGLLRVRSDGRPDEWGKGVALASRALGEVVECPIKCPVE